MASHLSCLLLLSCFALGYALNTNISLSSSLSPTATPTSWHSPSSRFAFGFYPEGSGFSVGAWLITPHNKTVIWTAFRNTPPFPKSVSMNLTDRGLQLLNTNTGVQNISSINSTTNFASIDDSGNFVIYGAKNEILWQTFDHPTDTIMAGQKLSQGGTLLSSVSQTDHSIGKFRLVMQNDGNLVSYPVDTYNSSENAYWASNTNNPSFTTCSLNLDVQGRLYVQGNNGTNNLTGDDSTGSKLKIYLSRLESYGVFRLYSYDFREPAVPVVVLVKIPNGPNPSDQCQIKGTCGFNSYCTSDDGQLECLCLPGFDYLNPNDRSNGCAKNSSISSCPSVAGENITMSALQNLQWMDDSYAIPSSINITQEGCRDACLKDCFCDAVLFDRTTCMKQKLPMKYGWRDPSVSTVAYVKIVTGGLLVQAPDGNFSVAAPPTRIKKEVSTMIVTLVGVVIAGLVIAIFVVGFLLCQHEHSKLPRSGMVEEILAFPRWFSCKELSEATGGFKDKLGKGSFGTVFKGALSMSRNGEQVAVAVKRLEKITEEGEQEFRAEMRAIGKTHHKNLVRLLGFCEEGSNRLLVYELMTNGSLAGIIFNAPVTERPHWSERVRIALDVARGINYLHEDCETSIIHCDIKPQNILMDNSWTAKISDFGLAQLLMPSQSGTFTELRGTRGYLAPEWAKNAPISVKADVYSFGVVLLEIICCRRNMELGAQSNEITLTDWAYNCFVGGELNMLVAQDEEVDQRELERLVMVGLWCIQNEPSLRPYMKNVVMMLDEKAKVPIPPQRASVV